MIRILDHTVKILLSNTNSVLRIFIFRVLIVTDGRADGMPVRPDKMDFAPIAKVYVIYQFIDGQIFYIYN